MDKETIVSYLDGIRNFVDEGKIVRAYEELTFVIKNLKADLEKAKVSGAHKTGRSKE